tara:strand:- start:801 stop:1004 length:204 start_codon:yes stop_codon:yes gene_type:complete
MDKHDRDVMVKELRALGLRQDALDAFSDTVISRLFEMIGWAAPAFTRDQVEHSDERNVRAEGIKEEE